MATYVMKSKEIPVVREVDVLVAGGGYAGFGAAICAARNGAKVLLVEQQSALGGLVTMGYVALTFSSRPSAPNVRWTLLATAIWRPMRECPSNPDVPNLTTTIRRPAS